MNDFIKNSEIEENIEKMNKMIKDIILKINLLVEKNDIETIKNIEEIHILGCENLMLAEVNFGFHSEELKNNLNCLMIEFNNKFGYNKKYSLKELK